MKNKEKISKVLIALREESKDSSLSKAQFKKILRKIESKSQVKSDDFITRFMFSPKFLGITFATVLLILTIFLAPLLKKIDKNTMDEVAEEENVPILSESDIQTRIENFFTNYSVEASYAPSGPKQSTVEDYFNYYNRGYYVDEYITVQSGPAKCERTPYDSVFFPKENYDLRVIRFIDENGEVEYRNQDYNDIVTIDYSDNAERYHYRGGDYIANIEKNEYSQKRDWSSRINKMHLELELKDNEMLGLNFPTAGEPGSGIEVTKIEDGYKATTKRQVYFVSHCWSGADQIREFKLDKKGNILSYKTFSGSISDENLISETFIHWSRREKANYDTALEMAKTQDLLPKGKEIKEFEDKTTDFTQNYQRGYDGKAAEKVAEKYKIKFFIPTSRQQVVQDINVNEAFYGFEFWADEFERDENFYSSRDLFESFINVWSMEKARYKDIFYMTFGSSQRANTPAYFTMYVLENMPSDFDTLKNIFGSDDVTKITEIDSFNANLEGQNIDCKIYHTEFEMTIPVKKYVCTVGTTKIVMHWLWRNPDYNTIKRDLQAGRYNLIDFGKQEDVDYFKNLMDQTFEVYNEEWKKLQETAR